LAPLFPVAAPSPWPTAVLAGGYATGFVVLVALALWRQAGIPAMQTLWAEDGAIFYSQAVTQSFWHTLVTAYNGYDQLVPRLAVQMVHVAPVGDAAAVVALAGAAGLAFLGCVVFHMARGHIRSPGLRALLVAAMVLLPLATVEMLDNLVNLPWWMFFASFWALLWRPQTRRGQLGAAALCALAAASEPLVGLLLPLAAVRAVALRRASEQAAGLGLLVGLVFQAGIVLSANGEHSFPAASVAGIAPAFGARVGLGWLTGLRATDAIVSASRGLAELMGALVFVVVVACGLRLGPRATRAFTVAVAVLAPVCFVVPAWLRGVGPSMQTARSVGYAGRYAAAPMLMVVSTVLVLAGHLSEARSPRRRPTAPGRALAALGTCCVLLVPAWAADFRGANGRADGPTWRSQLALAAGRCRGEKPGSLAVVAIDPPGMRVVVDCRTIGPVSADPAAGAGKTTRTHTSFKQGPDQAPLGDHLGARAH
jgi:hypothetical protein